MKLLCKIFGHDFDHFVLEDGSPLPINIWIPDDGKIAVRRVCARCGKMYSTTYWGNIEGKLYSLEEWKGWVIKWKKKYHIK